MAITKISGMNPPGLPAWPSVDVSRPGVTLVSGKLRDSDLMDNRAAAIGIWMSVFAAATLVIVIHSFLPSWKSLPDLAPNFPLERPLKESCQLATIGIVACIGMVVTAIFATFLVGYPISWLIGSCAPQLFLLEFKRNSVEILKPDHKKRRFDLEVVAKNEFHAAPATDSGTDDGVVVNLVYGGEVVRLFRFSDANRQAANDFTTCCKWAAYRACSDAEGLSAIRETKGSRVNDLD